MNDRIIYIISFPLLVVFVCCSGLQKANKTVEGCFIQGRLTDELEFWDTKVYLLKCERVQDLFSGSSTLVVDSAEIDENGYFCFLTSGHEDSSFYRLNFIPRESSEKGSGQFHIMTDRDNYVFLFLTLGSHVNLEVDGRDIPGAKIKGDKNGLLIEELMGIVSPLRRRAGKLFVRMQKLKGKQQDSVAVAEIKNLQNEFFKTAKTVQKPIEQFVDTVSSPVVAVIALQLHGFPSLMGDYWSYYREVVSELLEEAPHLSYLHEMDEKLTEFEKTLPIGSLAPPILLPDTSGQIVDLYTVEGSLILIDFWASWCKPCRLEIQETLKPLYEKYHEEGFQIFAVSTDKEKSRWIRAIRNDNTSWIHVACLSRNEECILIKMAYQVKGIPHTILIDSDRRIVAKQLRGENLESFVKDWFDK